MMRDIVRKLGVTSAKSAALVGIMAATVECGKLALAFLPNVEVVTLLLAVYGYTFGYLGVLAAFVFVFIEPLIYGFGPWVVSYLIYWPLVALIFCVLGRKGIRSRIFITAIAVGLTVLFGVLSSVVDVVLFLGVNAHFFANLGLYYIRGIVFSAVQIACNAVLFPILFEFLIRKLGIIKRRMSV